jgi:arylsulfatase A-like enzyme/tetratricopeptide (TPR) repeat protein
MQHSTSRVYILGFSTFAVLTLLSCKSSANPSPNKNVSSTEVSSSTVPSQPVNVIVITLDTVRADHLHCYGDNKIKTPIIDGLAKSGVLFEKAVAQTPLTGPSHASIFTGENPNVHHVRDTGGFALQPSSVTLATVLQRAGWDTAGFISAAVLKRQFGFSQGFVVYDDRIPETIDKVTGQPAAARPANITVDHAISWLDSQSSKPFLLWVHLYDAHQPYHPPVQFLKQYPKSPYEAEIAFEDQQLGRLLDAVQRKSPAGKTLILLLSDHGESLGQHGEDGHGIFLYDSTVRIAWIMAGPGVPAGVRIQQQAREIDVLPTILNLLGGKSSSAIQGTSMVPAFSGKTVPSSYSYEETLYPKINMGWSELRGIHTAHWMYILAPKPELYDLDQDPGELNNVITIHPEEFRELAAQLKQLSQLGNNNSEMVVTKPMDRQTINELRSLGYVGGSSDSIIELNGKGADPKDRVAVLQVIERATGPSSEKLPPVRKIALLQQALKGDPTNPYLYSALAEDYKEAGKNDMALQTCLAALHHGVKSGVISSLAGDMYLHAGHLKEAIVFFQQAVAIDPLNVERQTNLASAYRQNGQVADAERIFHFVIGNQLYATAYNGLASAYNGLGIIALDRHDYPTARKHFEHAIQLDQDHQEAEYNLGLACAHMHDVPCVRTTFQIFLAKVSPAYQNLVPQASFNLGIACAQTHDIPCVRTAFQIFLTKTPAAYHNLVPQAEYYLGVACAQMQDIPCARNAFRAFLVTAPPAYRNLVPQVQAQLNSLR